MKIKRYLNRELSWLEFNSRVLEQAAYKEAPLLERLKFIAIFASNLDEFFMVRVSGIMSQIRLGYRERYISGHRPEEVFEMMGRRIEKLVEHEYKMLNKEILPSLEKEGVFFYTTATLPDDMLLEVREKFLKKFLMILTPMAVDQARPFPFIPGKTLNMLVKLSASRGKSQPLYAVVPVPGRERFFEIAAGSYIYCEELVRLFLKDLFEGYKLEKACVFRIIRDAELSFDEEEARDLLSTIESELKTRERGYPVRLEVEKSAAEEMVAFLHERFSIGAELTSFIDGPLNTASFMEFYGVYDNAKLRDEKIVPVMPLEFAANQSTFSIIAAGDRLLNLPYESFVPVEKFVEEASKDPSVLAIKQTLYRTSGNSPIIRSLKRAANNGKQVTVVVELKATAFKPEHAGQLNFYLAAIDAQVKQPDDHPTIGLLLCKQQNRLVAEYALSGMAKPIGVAEYQLLRELPDNLGRNLPSIAEIEAELASERLSPPAAAAENEPPDPEPPH